jgi:hypothetical protein
LLPCCPARPGTEIIFTLQGETGKSVSQYSKQWLELVGKVKGWIRAGKNLNDKDVLVRPCYTSSLNPTL